MFNKEFDPYEVLLVTQHNTNELIKGHNQTRNHLQHLSSEIHNLLELIKVQRQMIEQQQNQINNLWEIVKLNK